MQTEKIYEAIPPKFTFSCQPLCIEFVEGSQQHQHKMVKSKYQFPVYIYIFETADPPVMQWNWFSYLSGQHRLNHQLCLELPKLARRFILLLDKMVLLTNNIITNKNTKHQKSKISPGFHRWKNIVAPVLVFPNMHQLQ